MTQQNTLVNLIDFAQKESDTASRRLAALHAQERELQDKLQVLTQYRDDYQNRMQKTTAGGVQHQALANFREFMTRLDTAILQQRKMVAALQQQVERSRLEWLAKQRKLKSYHTLADRQMKLETQRMNKREQREQDEHALKLSYQQRG